MSAFTRKKFSHGAIFIGVDRYGKPSGLTPLHYAYADAKALYELFLKNGYSRESCLLLPQNAQMEMSRSKISEPIEQLIECLDDEATLLIYFSGHGVEPNGREHFLLFHDAEYNGAGNWHGALTVSAVKNWAQYPYGNITLPKRENKHLKVILILDACRSDLEGQRSVGTKSPMLAKYDTKEKAHVNNCDVNPFVILESCSGSQCAIEVKGGAHGVFTSALLKILGSGLSISIGDVFNQLKCVHLGEQQPEIRSNVHLNEVMLFGDFCPIPQKDLVACVLTEDTNSFGAWYAEISKTYPAVSGKTIQHALDEIRKARDFIDAAINENRDFSNQLEFYTTFGKKIQRQFPQIKFSAPDQKVLWLTYANRVWERAKVRPHKVSPPAMGDSVKTKRLTSSTTSPEVNRELSEGASQGLCTASSQPRKKTWVTVLHSIPLILWTFFCFASAIFDIACTDRCDALGEVLTVSLSAAVICFLLGTAFVWGVKKLTKRHHLIQWCIILFYYIGVCGDNKDNIYVQLTGRFYNCPIWKCCAYLTFSDFNDERALSHAERVGNAEAVAFFLSKGVKRPEVQQPQTEAHSGMHERLLVGEEQDGPAVQTMPTEARTISEETAQVDVIVKPEPDGHLPQSDTTAQGVETVTAASNAPELKADTGEGVALKCSEDAVVSPNMLYAMGLQHAQREQYAEAFECYLSAAKRGHTEAQYALGNAYFYARGTTRNKSEAMKWYGRAAAKGHVKASQAIQRSHTRRF